MDVIYRVDELMAAAGKIAGETDLNRLYKLIIDILIQIGCPERALIYRKTQADNDIEIAASSFEIESAEFSDFLKCSRTIAEGMLKSGEEVLYFSGRKTRNIGLTIEDNSHDIFCAPILHEESVKGIIYIDYKTGNLDETTINNVRILLPHIALSIANAEKIAVMEKQIMQETSLIASGDRFNRMKNAILSESLYELKMFLNNISGIAESLMDGAAGNVTKETASNLSLINSGSKRFTFLLNDLLDMSKIRHKDISLQKKLVNIQQLLETTILQYCLGNDKLLEIDKSGIAGDLPAVLADETIMLQALSSLLRSFDRLAGVGNIIIKTNHDDRHFDLILNLKARELKTEKAEYLSNLLISNLPLDESIEDTAVIDIFIAKLLVEMHEGSLEAAYTKPDTFSYKLSLPLNSITQAKNNVPANQVLPSKAPNASSGIESEYKVLVVDDEPILVQLIRNYLSLNNYKVISAPNGREALKIIETNKDIDLVILDVMMPEMTGYEVCRIIREKFSLFELPVIILTVRNQVSDMIEGFEAGANDYISKPFDRNELLARAKTLIKLKKLTHANEILQDAIEIKNQFLNMTIHDLKNPLSVILGISDLIKVEADPKSEFYDFINLIGESAGLMHNLVNELLEAAKIESGKLMLHKEPLDLKRFAADMIEKNKMRARSKNQSIMLFANTEIGSTIFADAIRIQEIMDNLISNAIKYSPHNKQITISVISGYNEKGAGKVRFEVKDEGPGLTDDDKKKLFGKFQRLSAQPTGGESSSGLGLSIVKQLVDLHNGRIWAESEYGKGSTFIVEFPSYTKQEDMIKKKGKAVDS